MTMLSLLGWAFIGGIAIIILSVAISVGLMIIKTTINQLNARDK